MIIFHLFLSHVSNQTTSHYGLATTVLHMKTAMAKDRGATAMGGEAAD